MQSYFMKLTGEIETERNTDVTSIGLYALGQGWVAVVKLPMLPNTQFTLFCEDVGFNQNHQMPRDSNHDT